MPRAIRSYSERSSSRSPLRRADPGRTLASRGRARAAVTRSQPADERAEADHHGVRCSVASRVGDRARDERSDRGRRRPPEHHQPHDRATADRRAMGSRRSERVDDRVHRRPRRRAQKDEGDGGDGRVADEDEHDRQSGEQRRVPTDAKRRGPRAEPGDDRAHDRVYGRRGREEQSDLRGADAVLAQLQRHEKVDRASHEAYEHDDRDPREHELVGPSEPEDVGKTLLRRLGPRKRRRNEQGRGDECRRHGENEKRCPRVVAVGEDTGQYGAGREAETRNRRGERERSGPSLVRERIREPRGPRAPERAEGDPEGRARCEQRPELAREPLAECCKREQARRGDRHPAGSEAVGEDAKWQRDDECCEARSREHHPRLHARERELVRERRSKRDHRDPDEGLQQEERVDRQDGAAHGPLRIIPPRTATAASQSRVKTTVFGSVNASSTELPPTRPTPELEPARPPNGRWLSQ